MKHICDFRRWFFAVLVCILTISLLGCASEPPFRQPQEAIERIELIEVIQGEETLRCTLTGSEISAFMERLLNLTCYTQHPPVGKLGRYQIRLYYIDGDADFIGPDGNAYIENGKRVNHGWYHYKEEDIRELFAVYEWQSEESPKGKSSTD